MTSVDQLKDSNESVVENPSLLSHLSEEDTKSLQEVMGGMRLAQARLDRLGIKLRKKYQIGQQDRLWEDGEITRE